MQAQPGLKVVGLAHDGRTVLDLVTQTRPEVLLLDAVLPEIDGLGVLERLPAVPWKPRVIVLSSMGQDAVVAQVCAAGADYYLLKPVQVDVLTERIQRVGAPGRSAAGPTEGVYSPPSSEHPGDIAKLLHHLGVPAHIQGYRYLVDAVRLVIDQVGLLSSVTKDLYPAVAGLHGTCATRVERSIRHAIEVAWDRADLADLRSVFGNTVHQERGKPTNSEFIAMVADQLRRFAPRAQAH